MDTPKIFCTWREWVDQPPPLFEQLMVGGPMTPSSQRRRPGSVTWDKIKDWKGFPDQFKSLFSHLFETKFEFEPLPSCKETDLEFVQRTERGIEYIFTLWHVQVIRQAIKVVCQSFRANSLLESPERWPDQIILSPDAIAFADHDQIDDEGLEKKEMVKAPKEFPDWSVTTSDTYFSDKKGRNILPGETKRTVFDLDDAIKAFNGTEYEREEMEATSPQSWKTSPDGNPNTIGSWMADAAYQAESYAVIHKVRMYFILTNTQIGIFRRTLGVEPNTPPPRGTRGRPLPHPPQEGETPSKKPKIAPISNASLSFNISSSPSVATPSPPLQQRHDPTYNYESDRTRFRDDCEPQAFCVNWGGSTEHGLSVCGTLAGTMIMAADLHRRRENVVHLEEDYKTLMEDFSELHTALKQLYEAQ